HRLFPFHQASIVFRGWLQAWLVFSANQDLRADSYFSQNVHGECRAIRRVVRGSVLFLLLPYYRSIRCVFSVFMICYPKLIITVELKDEKGKYLSCLPYCLLLQHGCV